MATPWLSRADWAQGQIREQEQQGVGWLLGWLFCFIWFGGLGTIFLALPKVFEHRGASAFLIFMIAAGLVPLAFAVEGTRSALSPPIVFEMAAVPGVIGGTLRGQVRLPGVVRARQCTLTLVCTLSRRGSRRSSTSFLWMDIVDVPPAEVRAERGETVVPVNLRIPYGPRQTEEGDREWVAWHLHVAIEKAWGTRQYDFVVPVFYTKDSETAPPPAARAHKPPDCRIRVEERAGGRTVVRLPMSRVVLTSAFGPQLLAAALIAANRQWDLDLSVGSILALPELAALVAFSELFTRPRRIEVEPGALHVVRPFGRRDVIAVADVDRIAFEYNRGLEAHLRDKDRHLLATVGPDADDWLKQEVERAMARASAAG
jgi:hypothetical protein